MFGAVYFCSMGKYTSTDQFKDWLFSKIHGSQLVYNTCWEDPRCDRELLDIQRDSKIVMITSAGCNALDYSLDKPEAIHCVDMNPRQNALLELKLAAFRQLDFEDFFQLFGRGFHPNMEDLYYLRLRSSLPATARAYWDKKWIYFNGKGIRRSFYYRGTSGSIAWMSRQFLKSKRRIYRGVQAMLNADSLQEQMGWYWQVEPMLMRSGIRRVVNQHLTMSLIGVPRDQQLLFRHEYESGALGYLRDCLRKVFADQPAADNYFWKVYLNGCYTQDCCPEYLKARNFDWFKKPETEIRTHTKTITQFLKSNPGEYSHFVLLDHQDWMAFNAPRELEEEWRYILQNSRPGTKILMRSAASEIRFFPDFVLERVHFEKEKVEEVQKNDRVGTYASTYLGVVR